MVTRIQSSTGHNSRRGFEFSRLKTLLQQGKKIKMNRIINGSMTIKQYESYHNTLNTELLIVFLFLILTLSILFTIKSEKLK